MTLPSHANILLGTTPPFHGVHDNLSFIVADDFFTMAEYLKKAGYSTGAFVGSYLLDRRFGLDQGFDTYDDSYSRDYNRKLAHLERKAEEVVDPALSWLQKQISPWFLWIHCYDPHDPYDPPEPFKTRYIQDPYNGEVAYMDFALKRLVDLLETKLFRENTVVIFTADHGESLGEHGELTHGFLAYNSTLWVPLIMVIPGIKPGKVMEAVSHIDLFPTISDLFKLPFPEHLQGISLLPVLRRKSLPERLIYFESLYPYYSRGWAPIRGFYQGEEKFIDCPLPELYDLKIDFAEKSCLIEGRNLEKYKKQLTELIASLSNPAGRLAQKKADRETLDKLRSLGYISSQPIVRKEFFAPEDDVKTLLPHNNLAVEAMNIYQSGEKEKAIKILQELIKKCPHLDNGYSNLAIIYENEKELEKALETMRLGLSYIPYSYEFFFNYLSLLSKVGRFEEVIHIFEEKSSQFPQALADPEILNKLGIAYAQKGDITRAIDIYEMALSLDNKYGPLLSNLGTAFYSLFLQTKNNQALQRAQEIFKQAIEVAPDFAPSYYGLGNVYRVTGNLERAIFYWEKVLNLNPDFGLVYYHLGLAYIERKEFQKAFVTLKTYQERFGSTLSPKEKNRLTFLIQACQAKLTGK